MIIVVDTIHGGCWPAVFEEVNSLDWLSLAKAIMHTEDTLHGLRAGNRGYGEVGECIRDIGGLLGHCHGCRQQGNSVGAIVTSDIEVFCVIGEKADWGPQLNQDRIASEATVVVDTFGLTSAVSVGCCVDIMAVGRGWECR
jgi:hypothetical protein